MDYKFPLESVVKLKDSVTEDNFASINLSGASLAKLRKITLIASPYITRWGASHPYNNVPSYIVYPIGSLKESIYGKSWVIPEPMLELVETHLYKYQFTLVVTASASSIEKSQEYIAGQVEDMLDGESGILGYGKLKRVG